MCLLMCNNTDMRTNIDLDPDLIREAIAATGIKVKRKLVHEALRVLIHVKKRKPLSELRGKIKFQPSHDYKALRE